jgi:quercetin dioxygenase-like cupin family protein
MNLEARIFAAEDYIQACDGEPIRSVVMETPDSNIVVWHVYPGQDLATHIHPHGQDTWVVLSGKADYFQGDGVVNAIKAHDIVVAKPGQVHGARCIGDEAFVFVSVVASGNAGFALVEKNKTPFK